MQTTTDQIATQRRHPHDRTSHLPLEGAPRAVQAARHHARTTLRTWGVPHPVIEDALLVISELVTNAYLHTPSGTADLHLATDEQQLVIRVHDTCATAPAPAAAHPDPEQDHGRGLGIVRALAEAFGWTHTHTGKTAWARLSLLPAC
ncbi:ATP-binding protein [Streptomyces sp. NPDC053367]|uniref:ATP-binding protein n=1 Tax=Streptomyces sp. NPDC053367 TaxID=3365700 RepID=UPI0037CE8C12